MKSSMAHSRQPHRAGQFWPGTRGRTALAVLPLACGSGSPPKELRKRERKRKRERTVARKREGRERANRRGGSGDSRHAPALATYLLVGFRPFALVALSRKSLFALSLLFALSPLSALSHFLSTSLVMPRLTSD